MVQQPKAVKYKVILGYLLLSAVAVAMIWFVYTEILKIAQPSQLSDDNAKIIRVSNTIASLYASEALGRSAILSANPKELQRYNKLTDSISKELHAIRLHADTSQKPKFDRIETLLLRKKSSINEIAKFHDKYGRENVFTNAVNAVYAIREDAFKKTKPVKNTKKHEWDETVESLLTPKLLDSLRKLPVSNDSLAHAFGNALTDIKKQNTKLSLQLFHKEQKLLEENRIISDQLRTILTGIENEFITNSYTEVQKTRATLNSTVRTVAWAGAITLFFLIVLAWIIVRDLSINQNYRRQLELLNDENEQLLRTKSMLMATVTHDLQTPLGSIMGFNTLLEESGVNTSQKAYLDNIRESANYIMKLVNDLLDFSRLENNRITIENIPFNVKKTIEATCSTLLPMAENKGIELNWDIDDELDRFCLSDPYRIKQVLTNLVSNAIKFTSEGSVEVTAKITGFDITISVIDTGIGIAESQQHLVFKEFTQAHGGIEKKFGGTGLGLTISKRIITLLGGTINLESTEGQGSIFTIVLPFIAANEIAETKPREFPKNSLKGLKILIIDDDITQLKLMEELLNKLGAETAKEINPENILPYLNRNSVDIVLTDVQMPVMDGFELVQKIRNSKNNAIATLPVIALSGRRDLDNEHYLNAGFTTSHPKPVRINELTQLIAFYTGMTNDESHDEPTIAHPTDALYNLRSLCQFTQNDAESLRIIVNTFIESADDNCEEMLIAARNNDHNRLARIAHKMIPMLKQMEVNSIAVLLLPLEEKTLTLSPAELLQYCKGICAKMDELCDMLGREIA
ncbi:hybrid sensor histidine kinase/response regulator [Flavobacterium sp. RHBU_24]|uniref:hybrid sensor histidine kinase/response regulator n=1 Tax=Flavobacterium sp. RHBU_24 TaxID=3391185 RepID=UPI003984E6ED